MKKFLFLFTVAISLMVALPSKIEAQTSLISTGNSLTRDSVTNGAAKTLISPVISGYRATVAISVDVTKISGTLGGSLTAVVSNDGTNFYAVGSAFTVTDVASQGTTFTPATGFRYYGVRWTGTGTMSGSFVSKINTTKP
jgi:hypothetical protein